jgi:carbamoyl-phosphate synthase large subunit
VSRPVRVMVSGVGAVIGYGIARQLFGREDWYVIGTDWSEHAVGQAWSNEFLVSPPVASDAYIPWLLEVCSQREVEVYLPGFEQETQALTAKSLQLTNIATRFCLNSEQLVRLAADKLHFSEIIQARFPEYWIRTRVASDAFSRLSSDLGNPFVVKPRSGMARRGFSLVRSARDLECAVAGQGASFIAQEFVGSDDFEYTVGLFATGSHDLDPAIVLRRRLSTDGSTGSASREDNEILVAAARRLGNSLGALGPTNLQFRVDGDRLALLEVNPRFSSSTSIRSAFGYDEAEMAVRFLLYGAVPTQPELHGSRATRYWADYVE